MTQDNEHDDIQTSIADAGGEGSEGVVGGTGGSVGGVGTFAGGPTDEDMEKRYGVNPDELDELQAEAEGT